MSKAAFAMKRLFAILMMSLLMSCVSEKREGPHFVPKDLYELEISYSGLERAFLFRLTSHARNEICIPRMRWPSEEGGHYFFGDKRIYVVVEGVRYDIKDLASGYCTPTRKNRCIHILEENDELLGKLPIDDFVVPPSVYLDTKFDPQLRYPYDPHYCE